MNDLIKKWLPEIKKYWFIPVMILLGVLLLTRQVQHEPQAVAVSADYADQQFTAETEERVEEMLKGIEGAGECVVTITLASGGEKEYVRENGSVLVVTDQEGNQSPVLQREIAPEIAGVTVASKGAGNSAVCAEIIQSVSTVLGIGTNKICVVMMNG